jgi:hypothetical protein
MMKNTGLFLAALVTTASFAGDMLAASKSELQQIGVAEVDITPDYPIRLSGYLARKTESEGVAQRIYAKALAIGSDREGPAVLITMDATGVPLALRDEVARRLQAKRRIHPDRVTVCVTHTHCAPSLSGYLTLLFGEPIPPEHQVRIDRYTRELTDALEQVALAALKDRKPRRLAHGKTTATFAANRRTKGGPVDHDLPVLVVTEKNGQLRALFASYACHCTTLGADFNQVCGDWAGYAQEYLENDHPGATVLMAIGCAGDANPHPRPGLDFARQHGHSLATAVNGLLATTLTPIRGLPECRTKRVELPFDTPPTRAEWEEKAREQTPAGYHARVNLARVERGEALRTKLDYAVQSWVFGNDLALVFLPGEVVVDYALRLKREFDARRLWVSAYANDVPCYIPSERILKEGGYEGGFAMIYYDQPTKFAPGLEAIIMNAVREILPPSFATERQ